MPSTDLEVQEITDLQTQTPFNVVVHNDPINMMQYVVMVFEKVLTMNRETAVKHMLEVHKLGRSIVWSGNREQAEHYMYALQKWKLTVSTEASK